jgi:hypothetical protein
MPCHRCGTQLEDDMENKDQVWKEIFGDETGLLCDACYNRPTERLKSLWHALTCKICWKYHNLYDFKRWLRRIVGWDHLN